MQCSILHFHYATPFAEAKINTLSSSNMWHNYSILANALSRFRHDPRHSCLNMDERAAVDIKEVFNTCTTVKVSDENFLLAKFAKKIVGGAASRSYCLRLNTNFIRKHLQSHLNMFQILKQHMSAWTKMVQNVGDVTLEILQALWSPYLRTFNFTMGKVQ